MILFAQDVENYTQKDQSTEESKIRSIVPLAYILNRHTIENSSSGF